MCSLLPLVSVTKNLNEEKRKIKTLTITKF